MTMSLQETKFFGIYLDLLDLSHTRKRIERIYIDDTLSINGFFYAYRMEY